LAGGPIVAKLIRSDNAQSMLHFAYGSNMSTALMRLHCPDAATAGTAQLTGWRLIITRDGYASILPEAGATVHGVLWRLTARDWSALNAYESLDSGLYKRRVLKVTARRRVLPVLVYVGRSRAEGRPRPGYQELVVAAARDWQFPPAYLRELRRWLPVRLAGARAAEAGEVE
jgi:hypothetical protein